MHVHRQVRLPRAESAKALIEAGALHFLKEIIRET